MKSSGQRKCSSSTKMKKFCKMSRVPRQKQWMSSNGLKKTKTQVLHFAWEFGFFAI